SSCSCSLPPLPTPPLSPYTTLFRSLPPLSLLSVVRSVPLRHASPSVSPRDAPRRRRIQGIGRRRGRGDGEVSFSDRIDGQAEARSEEHTSELQSRFDLVCRLLLDKK